MKYTTLTFHGVGSSTLSITEISEELVDAIIAERSGKGGVLHFLLAEHNQCRISESSNLHGIFKVRLSHALRPKPSPIFLLVLVAELGEVLDEAVPAARLAVQDVWEEGNDTKRVVLTGTGNSSLRHSLHNLWRRNVLCKLLFGPFHNVSGSTAASVVLRFARPRSPILNSGISLDSVFLGNRSVSCGIQSSQAHLPLQLCCSIGPVRSKCLAVAAPWSIELNQKSLVRVKDLLAEV